MAARFNSPDVVKLLLDAGADKTAANSKGKTAYDVALRNEKLEGSDIIDILKPEPDLTPEQQEESLKALRDNIQADIFNICRSGTLEDIRQAVELNADLSVTGKTGATLLAFAAQGNTAEAVALLIENGLDPNAADNFGSTPLFYAAASRDEDIVNTLLDNGADKSITNNAGFTAYDYARRNYRLQDTEALRRLEA